MFVCLSHHWPLGLYWKTDKRSQISITISKHAVHKNTQDKLPPVCVCTHPEELRKRLTKLIVYPDLMSSNSWTSTLLKNCKASSSSSVNRADTWGWFTNWTKVKDINQREVFSIMGLHSWVFRAHFAYFETSGRLLFPLTPIHGCMWGAETVPEDVLPGADFQNKKCVLLLTFHSTVRRILWILQSRNTITFSKVSDYGPPNACLSTTSPQETKKHLPGTFSSNHMTFSTKVILLNH